MENEIIYENNIYIVKFSYTRKKVISAMKGIFSYPEFLYMMNRYLEYLFPEQVNKELFQAISVAIFKADLSYDLEIKFNKEE